MSFTSTASLECGGVGSRGKWRILERKVDTQNDTSKGSLAANMKTRGGDTGEKA